MTKPNSNTPTARPIKQIKSIESQQVMLDAEGLLAALVNSGVADHLDREASARYEVGSKGVESESLRQQRVGYLLTLEALIDQPDAVQHALERLRERLFNARLDGVE